MVFTGCIAVGSSALLGCQDELRDLYWSFCAVHAHCRAWGGGGGGGEQSSMALSHTYTYRNNPHHLFDLISIETAKPEGGEAGFHTGFFEKGGKPSDTPHLPGNSAYY